MNLLFIFSGCSQLIVTSQYEEIRIWDILKKKQELRRQVVPNMTCNALAITRDGKMIISGKEHFIITPQPWRDTSSGTGMSP